MKCPMLRVSTRGGRGEVIPPTTTPPDSTTPYKNVQIPPQMDIPAPPPASTPDLSASNRELRGAIQLLNQIVASQAQRLNATSTSSSSHPGELTSSRVKKFLQLDPPMFTGTNLEEDPQEFINEIHETLRKESHKEGSPPMKLNKFVDAFMDHFLPAETRAARAAKFENLNQGSMSVWDYNLRFADLSKYAIYMLHIMEATVHRFVQGLSLLVINDVATTGLNFDMNYGKMVAFSLATGTRNRRT
ncbi:uncharacterized protein [Nicotiana tomentosiformis]|uniref:uncharacterized protein n=1 Tax=Nicotiana tomentosiformis TaxID=4098 RepID=UPI00388CA2C6